MARKNFFVRITYSKRLFILLFRLCLLFFLFFWRTLSIDKLFASIEANFTLRTSLNIWLLGDNFTVCISIVFLVVFYIVRTQVRV